MPNRVASYTPLPAGWPHPLGALTPRVSVVKRPTFDENEWQNVFDLRSSEQSIVLESPHWLCVEVESALYQHESAFHPATAADARSAMLALQIWCPKGWQAIIINAVRSDTDIVRVSSVVFGENYFKSSWARRLSIDDRPLEELKTIVEGTLKALNSNSVPARNPFQYLEIGLQTAVNHPKAGALFWMIGLDALLSAQHSVVFEARLSRLLGRNSHIFPRDYAGRQPAYKVGELAADLYQLRNQIAHGDRIREKYLARSEFRLEASAPYDLGLAQRSFQEVVCEASLFALCAALRHVILDGHLELIQQPRAWKKWLDMG